MNAEMTSCKAFDAAVALATAGATLCLDGLLLLGRLSGSRRQ